MNKFKAFILFLIITLTVQTAFAQQTVKRSNYLSNSIMEKFEVFKADKKVRNGAFTATFKDVVVAKGSYLNGARNGDWEFYNSKGRHIQTYNYNQNKLSYLDTPDTRGIKYFMENVQSTDVVVAPVKIGGSCYGMLPLIYRSELGEKVRYDNPGIQKAEYTHIITINEQGAIVSHKVIADVNGNKKSYPLDDSHFDADVARFTPATINGKPVP